MRTIISILTLFTVHVTSNGQELYHLFGVQQPLFVNPGFAGANKCFSISPMFGLNFDGEKGDPHFSPAFSLTLDNYFKKIHSGFGLNAYTDNYNYINYERGSNSRAGIDYSFQEEYKCYRQALYQLIMRAKQLNLDKIKLGFSASIEKRKFGAQSYTPIAYMQTKDNYNLEVLGTMNAMKVANIIPSAKVN